MPKITIRTAEYGSDLKWPRQTREVEGELVGRYLAVHKRFTLPGDKGTTDWRVTHIPTGYAIRNGYKLKKDALEFARKIERLDWSSRSKAKIVSSLGRTMQAILSENPIKRRA